MEARGGQQRAWERRMPGRCPSSLYVWPGEDPLHRDGVRFITRHPLVDLDLERQKPHGWVIRGRSADHPDGDHCQRFAQIALDDPETAPGQAGVDTHDTHAESSSLFRTPVRKKS